MLRVGRAECTKAKGDDTKADGANKSHLRNQRKPYYLTGSKAFFLSFRPFFAIISLLPHADLDRSIRIYLDGFLSVLAILSLKSWSVVEKLHRLFTNTFVDKNKQQVYN